MTTSMVIVHAGVVGILAAGALLAGRGLRRPELAHALWLLVFVKLLIPSLVEAPVLPALPAARETLAGVAPSLVGAPLTLDGARPHQPGAGSVSSSDVMAVLLVVWALGALVVLAGLLRSVLKVRRELARAAAPDARLAARVARVAREVGLGRSPTVAVVDAAMSPAVWPGPPRAVLVLPRPLLPGLAPAELRSVLLHELMHLRRRDHWVRLLEVLVLAVYWWCPPVWWFRRHLRLQEEACCDAAVLRAGRADPETYAESLIKAAAVRATAVTPDLPRLATGAGSARPLSRRLQRIMTTQHAVRRVRSGRLALALVVLPLLPLLPTRAIATTTPPVVSRSAAALRPVPVTPPVIPDDEVRAPAVGGEEGEVLAEVLPLIAAGDLDAAVARLEEARVSESTPALHATLGNVLFQQERLDEAARAYAEALAVAPGDRRTWHNLAMIEMRRERYEAAAQALLRVVDLDGGDGTTLALLGHARACLGDDEGAHAAYRRALELDPTTLDWSMGMISTLFRLERHEEVLERIDTLLVAGEESPQLWRLKAHAALSLGRNAEAAAAMEEALQLGQASAEDHLQLADLRVNLGRYDEAAVSYVLALELGGAEVGPRVLQGARALVASGAPTAAARLLEALGALGSGPLQTKVLELAARLAEVGGDTVTANLKQLRAVLTRISALDPGDVDEPARILEQSAPEVPTSLGPHDEVTVWVLLVVGPEGTVTDARIETSTDEAFEVLALEAVERWTFTPARSDGQAVAVHLRVPVRFPARGQEGLPKRSAGRNR